MAGIGVERYADYFSLACTACPQFAHVRTPILNKTEPSALLTALNRLFPRNSCREFEGLYSVS